MAAADKRSTFGDCIGCDIYAKLMLDERGDGVCARCAPKFYGYRDSSLARWRWGRLEAPAKKNPEHRFGRDPFARGEMTRQTAGSGSCDWCGTTKSTLFRYGWQSDGGRRSGPAKGRFCNVSCFRSYHG